MRFYNVLVVVFSISGHHFKATRSSDAAILPSEVLLRILHPESQRHLLSHVSFKVSVDSCKCVELCNCAIMFVLIVCGLEICHLSPTYHFLSYNINILTDRLSTNARKEHVAGSVKVALVTKKTTEERPDWYGHEKGRREE